MLSRNNSTSQRTPRKSSSFLSLRREKEKSSTFNAANAPSAYNGPAITVTSSPYFEVYPRPQQTTATTRPTKSRNNTSTGICLSREGSPTLFPEHLHDDFIGTSHAFPTLDPQEASFQLPVFAGSGHGHYTRTRSRTGPSGKSKWEPGPVPQLRFSNSSSTQHTETPPRTPEDYRGSSESLDQFPVVVAAPVSGVETMDALVDGMNGGDIIGPSSARLSSRHRFGPIPGHHPLYQPPMPTPPPGIVLGGGKTRKAPPMRTSLSGDSSDDEDDYSAIPTPTSRPRKRRVRLGSARTVSNSTIIGESPNGVEASEDESFQSRGHQRTTSKDSHRFRTRVSGSGKESPFAVLPETLEGKTSRELPRPLSPASMESRKVVVPTILEIIRNHAPPSAIATSSRHVVGRSSSLYAPSSHGHAILHEEIESEPEPSARVEIVAEDLELLSRSSIDSVADEVQRTIRKQNQNRPQPRSLPPPTPSTAFKSRYSMVSDNASSIYSPRSDPGAAPSVYSLTAPSSYFPPSPHDTNFLTMAKPSASQGVAQYLRSARLTTLLKLTRSPHASADNPLTVSLSDLGNANGFPVVVFLGLGCVRHIMGLYDEMAQCMGLRLITIDRWGLGRTEPRSKSAKGIIQWAAAVEEVLDLLRIEKCSVMAHSAGAPYALSFANRVASRIRGDICLLAPWVGGSENSGYKWLKYVPNSILKTAQAAEWKVQAWMIGKPPTITYEGIGYTAPTAIKPSIEKSSQPSSPLPISNGNISLNVVYPSAGEAGSRPSFGSSSLSEYDDLRDFEGRFESRTTLALPPGKTQDGAFATFGKRKPSKGIFERLKGASTSPSQNHEKEKEKEKTISSSKKLRALTSMGSLKNRNHASRKSEPSSPHLPPPTLRIDVGLGLEDLSWTQAIQADIGELPANAPRMLCTGSLGSGSGSNPRSSVRRSISFTSTSNATASSTPGPPSPTSVFSAAAPPPNNEVNFQAQLGNALIAASHAESSKGTTNDLLQILNHENHSWGFSYANYPHRVRVWYGDRDEKIAENAVRWMERTMGPERCSVKVVKGADHGLMYRSSAVVDVLEWILSAWKEDRMALPFSDLR